MNLTMSVNGARRTELAIGPKLVESLAVRVIDARRARRASAVFSTGNVTLRVIDTDGESRRPTIKAR